MQEEHNDEEKKKKAAIVRVLNQVQYVYEISLAGNTF